MSGGVLALPVAAPLAGAALLVLFGLTKPGRSLALARAVSWGVSATVAGVGLVMLVATLADEILTLRLGGWPPGIAVVLVADVLSTLLVTVTSLLVLGCLAFAAATGEDAAPYFAPLALVLSAGVYGALLTGDLFNFFVFVELMLVPSYVLLVGAGAGRRVAAGRIYVATNLLASTVLLAGVGLLYGVTGTVNLGQLAGAATASPAAALAAAVVLVALAAKAAVVPLHSWLPGSYTAAGPAVAALFSGLLTKVGVYGLFRVYAVVFDGDPRWSGVVMAAALLTMVIGVLGAVGETGLRSILVFHMVSQIGYMLLGLALFTVAGVAAAVFFLVQYVLVKAALLTCAGAIEIGWGTDTLRQLAGAGRQEPLLAAAFGISALALVGVPPLSGFVAKLQLVTAAVDEAAYVAAGFVVAVSLLTLTSMLKVWNAVFVEPADPVDREPGPEDPAVRTRLRPTLVVLPLLLSVPAIGLALAAEPVLAVAEAAAWGLVHPGDYVRAVTSP